MFNLLAQTFIYAVCTLLAVELLKVAMPGMGAIFSMAIANPVETAAVVAVAAFVSLAFIAIWSLKIAYLGGTAGRLLDFIARNTLSASFYSDKVEQAIVDLKYEPVRLREADRRWDATKMAFRLYVGAWRCLGYRIVLVVGGVAVAGFIKAHW